MKRHFDEAFIFPGAVGNWTAPGRAEQAPRFRQATVWRGTETVRPVSAGTSVFRLAREAGSVAGSEVAVHAVLFAAAVGAVAAWLGSWG